MTRRLTFLALVSAFVSCLFMAGCRESTKPRPRECDNCLVPRTSPENVLTDLRIIYSVMDNGVRTPGDAHALAAQYRTLFDPDFRFYFVNNQQPAEFLGQNWWGRDSTGILTGEVPAFDTLMTKRARGIVSEITLSWTPGPAVPDDRTGGLYQPLHPGWMWIHVSSILLEFQLGDMTYMVLNGQADFYFAADPADTTLWVITEWQDWQPGLSPARSSGPAAPTLSQSMTWGGLKAVFR